MSYFFTAVYLSCFALSTFAIEFNVEKLKDGKYFGLLIPEGKKTITLLEMDVVKGVDSFFDGKYSTAMVKEIIGGFDSSEYVPHYYHINNHEHLIFNDEFKEALAGRSFTDFVFTNNDKSIKALTDSGATKVEFEFYDGRSGFFKDLVARYPERIVLPRLTGTFVMKRPNYVSLVREGDDGIRLVAFQTGDMSSDVISSGRGLRFFGTTGKFVPDRIRKIEHLEKKRLRGGVFRGSKIFENVSYDLNADILSFADDLAMFCERKYQKVSPYRDYADKNNYFVSGYRIVLSCSNGSNYYGEVNVTAKKAVPKTSTPPDTKSTGTLLKTQEQRVLEDLDAILSAKPPIDPTKGLTIAQLVELKRKRLQEMAKKEEERIQKIYDSVGALESIEIKPPLRTICHKFSNSEYLDKPMIEFDHSSVGSHRFNGFIHYDRNEFSDPIAFNFNIQVYDKKLGEVRRDETDFSGDFGYYISVDKAEILMHKNPTLHVTPIPLVVSPGKLEIGGAKNIILVGDDTILVVHGFSAQKIIGAYYSKRFGFVGEFTVYNNSMIDLDMLKSSRPIAGRICNAYRSASHSVNLIVNTSPRGSIQGTIPAPYAAFSRNGTAN